MKNNEEYTKRYKNEILAKLDPNQVLKDLGDEAIMLCFEEPGDFCHRRIVAAWLEANIPGLTVPEGKPASKGVITPATMQLGLFNSDGSNNVPGNNPVQPSGNYHEDFY